MEEIDLKELFTFIKTKLGLLMIITSIICLIGCVYGLVIQKPIYQSDTTIILSSSSSSTLTQTELTMNKNLVNTYAEIVKSRRVLEQVIEDLNLDLTYSQLSSMISVSAVNNTEIIRITVSDADAIKAKNIANTTAKHFAEEVTNLYNMNNVDVLDVAIEANKPYNINVIKQIVIYLMIGLVLAFGILFIIFYFDRSVKSIEQVEQKIKLPILGGVQELNKGVKKK